MKSILIAILLTGIITSAHSQADTKQMQIRTLLELTGSAKIGIQVMSNMINSYKNTYKEVPGDFWDEFMKEVSANELIDLIVPVYDKHFSGEEISQLIEFYKSPLGKKVVEKLPLISQDCYAIGEKWGQELAERVMNRLKAKGYVNYN